MEKKKNKITIIIYLLLIIVIIFFVIYRIIKNHEDRMYDVIYSDIEYKSMKCYLNKDCSESFSLSDLYEKKYLDILYDPISKEELDSSLVIKIKDNKVIFDK